MLQRIAASLISLNEADYIGRAILSLRGVVDFIALVDGGSMDDTVDIATKSADNIDVPIVIASHPWPNDFSIQRNRSLGLIPDNVDWWLRLDCDEAISMPMAMTFRRAMAGMADFVTAVRVRQVNLIGSESTYSAQRGGWETWPRIFKRTAQWHWAGEVHEHCVAPGESESSVADLNAAVIHYGWLDNGRRAERETLYNMPPGSLTNRNHLVKPITPFYRRNK